VYDIPVLDGQIDIPMLVQTIATLCHTYPGFTAVIENVHSLPRQAGAFNFGLGAGILRGVLVSHSIDFSLVAPSVWKPRMGLQRWADETPEANKSRARMLASQLFPHLDPRLKRVKDDGRAEALLMALYWSSRR
jgi:crossover junction endodeoxyribonuclease RuvC